VFAAFIPEYQILVFIGATWLIKLGGGGGMIDHSTSFCLYAIQIIRLKIFLFFICPSSNSLAKKLFLGRINIGGSFSPGFMPPSYANASIVIYVSTGYRAPMIK
jgi:hypothetical protein